jgi:hypothetical protein
MRRSRVPVLSLCQHDLVSDPGGLCPVSPLATGQRLRSSGMTLSALPTPEAQAPWSGYPLRVHDFQTTFEALYRPC